MRSLNSATTTRSSVMTAWFSGSSASSSSRCATRPPSTPSMRSTRQSRWSPCLTSPRGGSTRTLSPRRTARPGNSTASGWCCSKTSPNVRRFISAANSFSRSSPSCLSAFRACLSSSVSRDTRYVSFKVCECSRPAPFIVGKRTDKTGQARQADGQGIQFTQPWLPIQQNRSHVRSRVLRG